MLRVKLNRSTLVWNDLKDLMYQMLRMCVCVWKIFQIFVLFSRSRAYNVTGASSYNIFRITALIE